MQMQTGEGKSIVIAMLAIFVVKHLGKRVHVLENNQALLERDYASYKPFYERFEIKSQPSISHFARHATSRATLSAVLFNPARDWLVAADDDYISSGVDSPVSLGENTFSSDSDEDPGAVATDPADVD